MYCNYCGKLIQDDAFFCSHCGRRVGGTSAPRRLLRVREGRKIGGVCMGFAEYFEADATLIRIIAVLLAVFAFPLGEITYLAAWIVMPEAPLQLPAHTAQQTAVNPQL
jgi:phage shock protein C